MRLLRLVPALVVAGCVVTSGFGCHGWHRDPQKQIAWFAGHIEKKLDLRPDQQPAYKALVDPIKAEAAKRTQKGRDTMKSVKAEFEKDQIDIDQLATLAKARVRDRPAPEEIDAFIDQVTAFYRTLDPKQQKTVIELVRDKLDWMD